MAERLSCFHLQAPVSALWLEFDLDRFDLEQEPQGIPAPVICAKLSQKVDSQWLTGSLLPSLHGEPLSREQRELVHRALQEIPDSASLLYVFSLRSRGSGAVRLEIFGMETPQILDYLGKVAPERVPETTRGLELLDGAERLHLSFDVTEEILPRIGIEGSFPRQPSREPRWEGLFSRLVEAGLCSPEKRQAALAWPGYDSFWTAPERWPVAEIGPRGFCVRALSHLKVVCSPDRGLEAKAYLAFGPLDGSGTGVASSAARASAVST